MFSVSISFYMFIYFLQAKKTKLDVSQAVSSPNGLGRSKVIRGARLAHIIGVTIIQVLWTSTKPVICQEVVPRQQSKLNIFYQHFPTTLGFPSSII